jgi:hypothetical protein
MESEHFQPVARDFFYRRPIRFDFLHPRYMPCRYPELDHNGSPVLPPGVHAPYYSHYAITAVSALVQSADRPESGMAIDPTQQSDSIMTLYHTKEGTDRTSTSATRYSLTEPVNQSRLDDNFPNSGRVPATMDLDVSCIGTPPPTKYSSVYSPPGPSATAQVQRQAFERSARAEWNSIRIQCDGRQEVWYMRVNTCYRTARGFLLVVRSAKGEAQMEWKHNAGVEYPALFRDAVVSKKQFGSFELSSCDRDLLLDALDGYCGQKWVTWRKGRADWVAGGGIERNKAARTRREGNKSRAR